MDTNNLIAKRIRVARAERDFNQADLAERLGLTPQAITKLESGRIDMRVGTLERIAAALGKPMSYFFEPFPEEIAIRPKAESPAARAKKKKAA